MIDIQLFAERTISLEEIRKVRLMNRVDRKFVDSADSLGDLLEAAYGQGYMIQSVGDGMVAGYDTVYFDTPSLDNYLIHHNGHLTRQKLRVRKYLDNGEVFLEVKDKSNNGRTRKKRVSIPPESMMVPTGCPMATEFLEGRLLYDMDLYAPSLRTVFNRITLVNPQMTERVTIDTGLRFENLRNGQSRSLEGILIVEIKQDGTTISTMRKLLASLGIRRMGFSKYCIGTAMTDKTVKQNRFKEKIRYTHKLSDKNAFHSAISTGI